MWPYRTTRESLSALNPVALAACTLVAPLGPPQTQESDRGHRNHKDGGSCRRSSFDRPFPLVAVLCGLVCRSDQRTCKGRPAERRSPQLHRLLQHTNACRTAVYYQRVKPILISCCCNQKGCGCCRRLCDNASLTPFLVYSGGLSGAAIIVLERDVRLHAAPRSFIASCSAPSSAS